MCKNIPNISGGPLGNFSRRYAGLSKRPLKTTHSLPKTISAIEKRFFCLQKIQKMSSADFRALGADAVARRAVVVAANGNVHFALHAFRRALRARPHACRPVLLSGVTTSRRTTRARTPVLP